MAFEYLLNVFKKNPIFKDADDETLVQIITSLHVKRVDSGEKIIKQGEQGDKFFIIHTGKVSVRVKTGLFRQQIIAYLINDDCFGEMALFTNELRNATVVAEEYTELFSLSREAFENIIMNNPSLRKNIEDLIAKRKAEQTNSVKSKSNKK